MPLFPGVRFDAHADSNRIWIDVPELGYSVKAPAVVAVAMNSQTGNKVIYPIGTAVKEPPPGEEGLKSVRPFDSAHFDPEVATLILRFYSVKADELFREKKSFLRRLLQGFDYSIRIADLGKLPEAARGGFESRLRRGLLRCQGLSLGDWGK